jgi:hypothetical protein
MIYKQIIPFIKKSPLSYVFNYCDTLVNPYIYSLDLKYKANKVEESYYDINKQSTFDTITMSRYFDYIQPAFEEQSIISSYNMKYKNTKKGLKVAYYTNESIYPLNMSINNYPGIRLYDMKGDQQSYIITSDPEYKHFNDNHYINLEESFTYIFETELTTAQVLYYETETSCKNIFKDHIERYSLSNLSEDIINWIYNKYQVSVGCTPSSLNASLDEKLYKLELYYELY